jgi:hypothetical protein
MRLYKFIIVQLPAGLLSFNSGIPNFVLFSSMKLDRYNGEYLAIYSHWEMINVSVLDGFSGCQNAHERYLNMCIS